MNEARRVLERLKRIHELDRQQAPAGELLSELRELIAEAGAWARLEGDERAMSATDGLAVAVAGVDEAVGEPVAAAGSAR